MTSLIKIGRKGDKTNDRETPLSRETRVTQVGIIQLRNAFIVTGNHVTVRHNRFLLFCPRVDRRFVA